MEAEEVEILADQPGRYTVALVRGTYEVLLEAERPTLAVLVFLGTRGTPLLSEAQQEDLTAALAALADVQSKRGSA